MTREEAKQILALHRPGATVESDPRIGEALELLQHDPELAAWFEQQCAVFDAIRGKLKSVPVPQGLRQQIISAHAQENRARPFANRMVLVASIAAVLVVTAVIFWSRFTPDHEMTFDGYRDRMARMVQRTYGMQMTEKDLAKIREYFGSRGAPTDYVLPKSLEKLPGEGGMIFTWNNHQVSLLCLDGSNNSGAKNDLYLFMASRGVLPGAPDVGKKPEFKTVSKYMTVTWTVGDKVYLLAGAGDKASFEKYLE